MLSVELTADVFHHFMKKILLYTALAENARTFWNGIYAILSEGKHNNNVSTQTLLITLATLLVCLLAHVACLPIRLLCACFVHLAVVFLLRANGWRNKKRSVLQ